MDTSQLLSVNDLSQVGEVRRAAAALAVRCDFGEERAATVALVATELATNLIRHGRGGDFVLNGFGDELQLLTLDKGPGMDNVAECLRDGYSTGGTPGTGFGAIGRLSSSFDVYSQPGKGTAVFASLARNPDAPAKSVAMGAVCVPLHGESVSGDAWDLRAVNQAWKLMMVDGLGHGLSAHDAARAALTSFDENYARGDVEILHSAHAALRTTRGAALAVASLRPEDRQLAFCGVGNVALAVVSADVHRKAVSHNGIVGHQMRKTQEFLYPLPAGALVVMCTDGIATSWDLRGYPGLLSRHPAIVAGIVFRDFRRERDDATVVVLRVKA